MSAVPPVALPADVAQPSGFLQTLLAMSLTAVAVLRPLYAEQGEVITDFAWVSLNPAGQRMLGQPECPTSSLLTLFPTAKADGVFAVCCRAFETGELGRNQTNYQADGLDGYFLLVAQRYADLLVVNFTDTNDQPRAPVEEALRASQQREQAARAEAEAQRANLTRVFQQAPAAICVLAGPELTFELFNPLHQRLFPGRVLLGRPLREAMPDLWDHEGGTPPAPGLCDGGDARIARNHGAHEPGRKRPGGRHLLPECQPAPLQCGRAGRWGIAVHVRYD